MENWGHLTILSVAVLSPKRLLAGLDPKLYFLATVLGTTHIIIPQIIATNRRVVLFLDIHQSQAIF